MTVVRAQPDNVTSSNPHRPNVTGTRLGLFPAQQWGH